MFEYHYDSHSRLELLRFLSMNKITATLVNVMAYLLTLFSVEDIDEMLIPLSNHGAWLVDEVVQ